MSIPTDGKVYFAGCYAPDGYDMKVVKIGCANNPAQRILAVQTGQPFECRLLAQMHGDTFLEYFVHMWLRQDHVSGEFFHIRDETARLINFVAERGKHPFPIEWEAPEGWFRSLDLVQFMERHDITVKDVRNASGVAGIRYDLMLKKDRCGNRRFLAALAVCAVRRGISLRWPTDFRASRTPEAPTSEAAA